MSNTVINANQPTVPAQKADEGSEKAVGVTSTAVKAFRGVSTALLALCVIGAAVMLILSFAVGPFVPVLGFVVHATTAAFIAGGAAGVLSIPTLYSWFKCGQTGTGASDTPPPAIATEPLDPKSPNGTDPTLKGKVNERPVKQTPTPPAAPPPREVIQVNVGDRVFGEEVVKEFVAALAKVGDNGTVKLIFKTQEQLKAALSGEALKSVFSGSADKTKGIVQLEYAAGLTEKVKLSNLWAGKRLDVSLLTFGDGGSLDSAGVALASVVVKHDQSEGAVGTVVKGAKGVVVTGIAGGSTYDVPAWFFGDGQGADAETARLIRIAGAQAPDAPKAPDVAASTTPIIVILPPGKHVMVTGGSNVYVQIGSDAGLSCLHPDSDVVRYFQLDTAGAVNLAGCGGKDVCIGANASSLVFGGTVPSSIVCYDQACADAVTSINLSALEKGAGAGVGAVPQVRVSSGGDSRALSAAFRCVSRVIYPKDPSAAEGVANWFAGTANVKEMIFEGDSVLPGRLRVLPDVKTLRLLGGSPLKGAVEFDISGCDCVPAIIRGSDTSGTNLEWSALRGVLSDWTTIVINANQFEDVVNKLPGRLAADADDSTPPTDDASGSASPVTASDDRRIPEIRIVNPDGFNNVDKKLIFKPLIEHAKKVVVPMMPVDRCNFDGLGGNDGADITSHNIHVCVATADDGAETLTHARTLGQLRGLMSKAAAASAG
ncbi:MAG: hypothetical protein LBF26_00795 [Puniceicoccales bacterium]|jgi:hypothetical protein|nr:hypothetical protein [Puniceicoccales bacterium]